MGNDAVLKGLIQANPAAVVPLPERERLERRFLSADELHRIEAAMDP
jgi:hypothetical protein